MIQNIKITDRLKCVCSKAPHAGNIAYLLYPMELSDSWVEQSAKSFNTTIVVITGMDWQNVFSPWPAKGVPAGTPDFKGEAPEFLAKLRESIIPQVERELEITDDVERTLVGVSMSGLFALWQWLVCDTFTNIISLSGSFWYEGFAEWVTSRNIPAKSGKAYFLLGVDEPKSKEKAFATVGSATQEIIAYLGSHGVSTIFQSVPGNHYSDPLLRLNKGLTAIFAKQA